MSCYTGISAGGNRSLALLKDGSVTGWGDNFYDQTNIPVGIGTNTTGIAAGAQHSLALLKDGRVTGWGRNNVGQTNIPVGIGNNATGIAAGWDHSIALLKDGRVTGWGDNQNNQLNIPAGIGNNATGIAAGGGHSLALLKDGRVTGWGRNDFSQTNIPVGIGTNATGIAAGGEHSLALLKDGRVTGWGSNSYGETNIPVGIGTNATGIAAGFYHSLALLKDGRVTGWGFNSNGQINIPVGIANNATGIAAGYYHSLALLKDGRVTGWGLNNDGQINIPKCSQTLTFPSILTKVFGDPSFNLNVTSTNNTIAITYSSSNTNVATVSSNGTVSIVGAGNATITASQAGDSNYNAATPVSRTLTVNKGNQTITFPVIATKTFGDANFSLGVTSNNNTIAITYSSSNTSVATVSSNGTVTIVGAGTSTITANQAGDNNWNAATPVSRTLTVNKGNQTITFPVIPNLTYTQLIYLLNATASSNLIVTYTIDLPTVATINGSLLNIIKVGTATITANQAGDNNWNPAPSVSRTVTITRSIPNISNISTSEAYVNSRLSDIQIFGTSSTPGSFYWSIPNFELTSIGQQNYPAIFVPNDVINFENVNLNIPVNVIQNPWKLLLIDELPKKLSGVNCNLGSAYSVEYQSNYLTINGRPVYYFKNDPTIYTINGYSASRKVFDKNGNIF